MKLIDADALVRLWTANGDYENCIYDGAFVVKNIENAPTIEAIPVSVIKEEMFRLEKCQLYTQANYLGGLLTYWELVMKGEEHEDVH